MPYIQIKYKFLLRMHGFLSNIILNTINKKYAYTYAYNSDKVERVYRRAARFVKSRYSIYSSVSDMLDVLGWTPLFQRRQEARLILFYKIINGLTQVPFEGVLAEAYKGTRRKHSMKCRQIGHTTSQYEQSFFHKTIVHGTGLLSLKLRHWLY